MIKINNIRDKLNTKQLLYISWGKWPNKSANNIQVFQMCHAFQQLGIKTSLITSISFIEWLFHRKAVKVRATKIYGAFNFDLVLIPNRLFVKYKLPVAERKLYRRFYSLYLRYRVDKRASIYSRDKTAIETALNLGFSNLFWEVHKPGELGKIFKNKIKSRIINFKIVVISKYLWDHWLKEVENTRIKLLLEEDGVQFDEFQQAIPKDFTKQLGNTNKTITYCGSLGPGRGLELLQKFALENLDLNVLVIGGKPGEFETKYGSSLNLKHLSHISITEVPGFLKASSLLVMPYSDNIFSRDYMSPLKLYEYLATGVPVLSSNLPILKEIIERYHCGYLFEHDDFTSFSREVHKALNSMNDHVINNGKLLAAQMSWANRCKRILV